MVIENGFVHVNVYMLAIYKYLFLHEYGKDGALYLQQWW